jgi:hypothetical protein
MLLLKFSRLVVFNLCSFPSPVVTHEFLNPRPKPAYGRYAFYMCGPEGSGLFEFPRVRRSTRGSGFFEAGFGTDVVVVTR